MSTNAADRTPVPSPDDPEAVSEMSFPASDPPSTSQPTLGGSTADDGPEIDGPEIGSTPADGPEIDGPPADARHSATPDTPR